MATKYGTVREIEAKEKELASLRALESDPYRFGSIQDKNTFRIRKKLIERNLEKITPPPVKNDKERKYLEDRAAVLESFIKGEYNGPELKKPKPLSRADRWERPTGATGQFLANEKARKHFTVNPDGNVIRAKDGYGAAFELKDIGRRLHSRDEQMENPDIGNVDFQSESFSGRSLINRSRMTFAQGTGISQEQWNETVGPKGGEEGEKKSRGVPIELQCTKTKKDGNKCTAKRLPGTDHCRWHGIKEQ